MTRWRDMTPDELKALPHRARVIDRKTGEKGTIVDIRHGVIVDLITDDGIAFSGLGIDFVCQRWRIADEQTGIEQLHELLSFD